MRRDKERLEKKLDAPKEASVLPDQIQWVFTHSLILVLNKSACSRVSGQLTLLRVRAGVQTRACCRRYLATRSPRSRQRFLPRSERPLSATLTSRWAALSSEVTSTRSWTWRVTSSDESGCGAHVPPFCRALARYCNRCYVRREKNVPTRKCLHRGYLLKNISYIFSYRNRILNYFYYWCLVCVCLAICKERLRHSTVSETERGGFSVQHSTAQLRSQHPRSGCQGSSPTTSTANRIQPLWPGEVSWQGGYVTHDWIGRF